MRFGPTRPAGNRESRPTSLVLPWHPAPRPRRGRLRLLAQAARSGAEGGALVSQHSHLEIVFFSCGSELRSGGVAHHIALGVRPRDEATAGEAGHARVPVARDAQHASLQGALMLRRTGATLSRLEAVCGLPLGESSVWRGERERAPSHR